MKGKLRTVFAAACALLLCVSLAGCVDYRGLNEITIVTGIAIDLDPQDPEALVVNFEIVDTSSLSKDEVKTTLVEARGGSLAQAVANTGQKLHNSLYFGNTEIIIIGQDLARQKDLNSLIDPLLRDSTIRDNLTMLVSREKTAKDFIQITKDSPRIVSFELNTAIGLESRNSLNSTRALELDQIYASLSRGADLTMPAVRLAGEEKKDMEIDGLAIFHDGKLEGFCGQEEVPYYVITTTDTSDGNLQLDFPDQKGEPAYISVMNRQSKPKRSVRFDGERFILQVDLQMKVAAVEFSPSLKLDVDGPMTEDIAHKLEDALSAAIQKSITGIREEFGADIYDFGGTLRNHNPQLWRKVEKDWPAWYKNAEIQVKCKVLVNDTGLMKDY